MVSIISPNLVCNKKDLFTTGIPYMPIGAVYLASSIKATSAR